MSFFASFDVVVFLPLFRIRPKICVSFADAEACGTKSCGYEEMEDKEMCKKEMWIQKKMQTKKCGMKKRHEISSNDKNMIH